MWINSNQLNNANYPNRATNEAVKTYDLHHLRRFVKPENLPSQLKEIFESFDMDNDSKTQEVIASAEEQANTPNSTAVDQDRDNPQALSIEHKETRLYFLIGSESNISFNRVLELLSSLDQLSNHHLQSNLRKIVIPLLPPTSADQARRWSQYFWPAIYKNSNPFGPHPSIVAHAEAELHGSAGRWMNLAERAGIDGFEAGMGEPIGAALVDRNSPQGPSVVVIAGDARWHGVDDGGRNGPGNVLAHAVMRAIGMVARKRRAVLEKVSGTETDSELLGSFADQPLTPAESSAYSRQKLKSGGYLCLGLELYLTHEPCTMCSMAMLHSRFARIIFGERLPRTGGIIADASKTTNDTSNDSGSLNYGLFWRPELNWKMLAWQWESEQCTRLKLSNPHVHA